MEMKCLFILLFVCLAYGASAHITLFNRNNAVKRTNVVKGTNEKKALILAAISNDDENQTKALIEQLIGDFNGNNDITWLGEAAEKCSPKVAKMLIQNGVSPNVVDKIKWRPLHVASYWGCEEVAKILIDNGADINITNGIGKSPLRLAKENGKNQMIKFLIKNGADTSIEGSWYRAYVFAHQTTDHTDAESTTENDMNQKVAENDERKEKDNTKDMILDAISGDDGNQTETLIEDLIADYFKVAVEKCKPKVAKMLIQNGVNVNLNKLNGEWKWRPLHVATYFGCEEVARILIHNGADINAKTRDGYTALHLAAKNGKARIAELLINNGADIELKDSTLLFEWTALEWAQYYGHSDVVKDLIDNGAKTDSDYSI